MCWAAAVYSAEQRRKRELSSSDPPETEETKANDYPKISSIEEKIDRAGQVVLWLRNLSRFTKKPKQKHQLQIMMQAAIDEFIEDTQDFVKLMEQQKEKLSKEANELENNARERKGQKIRELFDEQ